MKLDKLSKALLLYFVLAQKCVFSKTEEANIVSGETDTKSDSEGSKKGIVCLKVDSSTGDLKLFEKDSSNNLTEIEESKYKVTKTKNEHVLLFKKILPTELCVEEEQLWKYDEESSLGEQPYALYYNVDSGEITLIFVYNKKYKRDSNGKWTGTDSGLKLFTHDPNDNSKNVELDTTKYDLTTQTKTNDIFNYGFKTDSKCTLIKCDDKDIWKYESTKYGESYPKLLSYNKTTEKLLLKFDDLDILFDKKEDDKWVYSESGISCIKLFKADPNDATKSIDLDTNDYTVVENGNESTYEIKQGINCTKLMFGLVLLWKYDSTKHGGKYPKSLEYNKKTNKVVLKFEGLDITFEKKQEIKWVYSESGISCIKLHKVDPNNTNNTVELGSSEYKLTEEGDNAKYEINQGINCTKLMFGLVLLWKYDSTKHGGKYPKSLEYNKKTNKVVLKFEGLNITFEKNAEGKWVYT